MLPPMKTDALDYHLPPERIAQIPASPRDTSKLLVTDRDTGLVRADAQVFDLPRFLRAGDLIVLNETRVFRARLAGTAHGHAIELFLVRPISVNEWTVLVRGARRLAIADMLSVHDISFSVLQKNSDGTLIVHSPLSAEDTIAFANRVGSVPTPPYIHASLDQEKDYQTVYAKTVGSVAAPTAGFHFTPTLIETLRAQGVSFAPLTLHVGLGTFLPIKTEDLTLHHMHAEWASLPQSTVDRIEETRARGGRIIAVGTTTVRTLEGVVACMGSLKAFEGDLSTFITPGWQFRVVDAMLTNFHLPKTTLLALVAAFLEPDGLAHLHTLYAHALAHDYRFASFGDAMLVLPKGSIARTP